MGICRQFVARGGIEIEQVSTLGIGGVTGQGGVFISGDGDSDVIVNENQM